MTDWMLAGDLGGTKMAAALIYPTGQIAMERSSPTQPESGIETVTQRFAALLRDVLTLAGERRPTACGVAVLGHVDPDGGLLHHAANLPGERDYPLRERLERAISLPVFIDNDVRLHALGEHAFGAAKGVRHFLFVAVGTGVGGALYVDGNLYHGEHNNAAEIGHIRIDASPTAPICGCGRRGCLEVLASGPAMAADFIRRAARHDLTLESPPTLREIAQWVDRSDLVGSLARETIEQGARLLGQGLAIGITLLDPELVVLGGGVAASGSLWLRTVQQTVAKNTHPQLTGTFVVLSHLGGKAALIGAGTLARQRLGVTGHVL